MRDTLKRDKPEGFTGNDDRRYRETKRIKKDDDSLKGERTERYEKDRYEKEEKRK